MFAAINRSAIALLIASTRNALVEDLEGIGEALDVTSRLRSSFRLHPLAWVAGAVGVGVLAATLFRRGQGGGFAQWRPMLLGTLGFLGNRALTASLPAIGTVLETELNRWLARRRPAATDATPHEARVSL
jgi:hypothetical protein